MRKLIIGMVCLTTLAGPSALAQDRSAVTGRHAPHHRHFVRLAPHHQPRRGSAPEGPMGPTTKEQAVDRKINHICRGC
jgi:Ni/Co efflux regulator RcnB